MAYPIFSEINTDIYNNINSIGQGGAAIIQNKAVNATSHYPWLRVISGGGGTGCIMYSNPDVPLIMKTTEVKDKDGKVTYVNSPSSYGNQKTSGMIGYDWKGTPIYPDNTIGIGNFVLKPSPVILPTFPQQHDCAPNFVQTNSMSAKILVLIFLFY